MLTREQISDLGRRFQIDPLSVVREYLQVLFLEKLSRVPDGAHWYFKGGTAIRLLGQSFRFSEDLDFTVTQSAREVTGLLERVILSVRQEVPEVSLGERQAGRAAVAGRLRYAPATLKYPLVVRLQCSLRERPRRPRTSLLETVYPIPYPWVQHLDWPEILAEKVRALLIWGKGRDLFDLWFLQTKGIALEWPLIRAKMAFYKRSADPKDLLSAIQRIDSGRLQRDLSPFLPREYRRLAGELKSRVLEQISKQRPLPLK